MILIAYIISGKNQHGYFHYFFFSVVSSNMSDEIAKARAARKESGPTIFSKIVDKTIPADIIHEDEHVIAFRDVHPQAPVHFLVIPKKPIAMLDDAGEEDKAVSS
jgi:histidine triad (HIT) family protein